MAICTLRQKIAVIEARLKAHRLYTQTIAEWQTKTLAQFVAATVPSDQGGKQLSAQAAKIHLRLEDDEGKALDDRPLDEVIETGSNVAENRVGSFERLTAGFG